MPTVSQLQAGIQVRLDTIASLTGRTYAFQPDTISPPCAWTHFPTIPAYHEAMGMGLLTYDFPVIVAVGSQVDRAGQAALEAYISPSGASSVRAAVEADTTLGGLVGLTNAMVVDFRPMTLDETGTFHAYGGVWTVRVVSPGV